MKKGQLKKDQCVDMPSKNGLSGLSRRNWLRSTAWIIAAGTFSRVTAWAVAEISPVMDKLSAYMTEARNRELPEKALRETEHHILDTVAAMVSGSDLLPGREAIKFAQNYGGEKIATVVASKVLCGPIEAALANGQLAHSDE
ncbi:MAG TPA: MmgE/PrpD family protein, partial [Candidatus Acidoferrum sp.]|nr:MmgE/PrpD family protein [Candidatus Acidoferrum sp.]